MVVRVLACAVMLVLPIAGDVHARASKTDKPGTATDLVWPLPPDAPRIRYVDALHGASDYAKKHGSWRRILLGEEPDPGISLLKPYGAATDAVGRVYVSDTGAGAVLVFDPRTREVGTLGTKGRVHLMTPIGVALDELGRVFVADASLHQVFCFNASDDVLLALGRDEGMKNPTGLAVDKKRHRLYVADSYLHQILVYATSGQFLARWGSRGSGDGEFNFPTNLAVDPAGNLFVVDTGNFRVQILDPDGKFVSTFGKPGDVSGSFHRPKGIAIDSKGHVYVADAAFNNFQIFDREGNLLLYVGSVGREAGNFWLPAGLHIDEKDRIFVVDQLNRRVQVFQYVGD